MRWRVQTLGAIGWLTFTIPTRLLYCNQAEFLFLVLLQSHCLWTCSSGAVKRGYSHPLREFLSGVFVLSKNNLKLSTGIYTEDELGGVGCKCSQPSAGLTYGYGHNGKESLPLCLLGAKSMEGDVSHRGDGILPFFLCEYPPLNVWATQHCNSQLHAAALTQYWMQRFLHLIKHAHECAHVNAHESMGKYSRSFRTFPGKTCIPFAWTLLH